VHTSTVTETLIRYNVVNIGIYGQFTTKDLSSYTTAREMFIFC